MEKFVTFEEIQIFNDYVVLNGNKYKASIGKHEIWIPDLELKFVWSFNGKIEAYRDWDRGRHAEQLRNGTFNADVGYIDEETKNSILNEYMIFRALGKLQMAPPVGHFVFAKTVVSQTLGYTYCDPIGMYGFHMQDARSLPAGLFSSQKFLDYFLNTNLITASKGAYYDIFVPKRNNVVNGYLIDVRRTIWDMMHINEEWKGYNPLAYKENLKNLRSKIEELGQFPFRQRKTPYQSYYLNNKYTSGTRDTLYRYKQMDISGDLTDKSVLDLGCCFGSMCIEAFKRGARNILGMDNQPEYVDCARHLARANKMPMNFLVGDLNNPASIHREVQGQFLNGVDIVFALSLYKHVGTKLWEVLGGIEWRTCYLESNNAPEGLNTGHVKEMWQGIQRNGWKADQLPNTEDRSPRVVWRLIKTNV